MVSRSFESILHFLIFYTWPGVFYNKCRGYRLLALLCSVDRSIHSSFSFSMNWIGIFASWAFHNYLFRTFLFDSVTVSHVCRINIYINFLKNFYHRLFQVLIFHIFVKSSDFKTFTSSVLIIGWAMPFQICHFFSWRL